MMFSLISKKTNVCIITKQKFNVSLTCRGCILGDSYQYKQLELSHFSITFIQNTSHDFDKKICFEKMASFIGAFCVTHIVMRALSCSLKVKELVQQFSQK